MHWAFTTNFQIPLQLSRVVIRCVYGCKPILDDFEDIDKEFAESNPTNEEMESYILPYERQLKAIRNGVFRAIDTFCVKANDPMFARIYQMTPIIESIPYVEELLKDDILEEPIVRIKATERTMFWSNDNDTQKWNELVEEVQNELYSK
ncbi:hypothetical protein GPJ56_009910 [Histomonas meleagridis]|uniref:uncharacterized protein n=1 Tax=Histomonas meleagridis TaxID=135588 RepID=UPI0035599486|nr:hypothetical protein GPJ56_009910 [Histomonas meleagridis]KAH0802782.1 hypothetical protein GO595_004289 [Histomonas meleagridis]